MSRHIRRHIGQLVMAGFPGPTIPDELRAVAREYDLGGIILFGRNVEAPEQVAELAYDAQAMSNELPLWVSIDQEGGRVARLKEPFTVWPPMCTLGRSGDVPLAARFARALARELLAVGVSLDYAPVIDIHTNTRNPVIGDRALSDQAEDVARLGAAIIGGLQGEGVAACGKHFPGHGDTNSDSHHELPVIDHPRARLREVELVPFRAAVASDVAMIMTAHVLYPALDEERPATLSPCVVTEILRQELGFSGLIATDDLSMRAITADWSVERASVAAIAAGCDVLLLCAPDVDQQVRAVEALIRAVEGEVLPAARIEDALQRQCQVKGQFLTGTRVRRPLSSGEIRAVLGCDEHTAVADAMRQFA
jgi:beta-N-acetylhexosaminidase